MKDIRCDVCDKPCQSHELTELFERYRTEGIKDVCRSCYSVLTSQSLKIDMMLKQPADSLLKRFMVNMRDRLKGTGGQL